MVLHVELVVLELEQIPQGNDCGPNILKLSEFLDNALRVWILGGSMWS